MPNSVGQGAWSFAFFTSSQVLLMWQGWEPNFEKCSSTQLFLSHRCLVGGGVALCVWVNVVLFYTYHAKLSTCPLPQGSHSSTASPAPDQTLANMAVSFLPTFHLRLCHSSLWAACLPHFVYCLFAIAQQLFVPLSASPEVYEMFHCWHLRPISAVRR